MSARAFVDSNILVYLHDVSAERKQAVARRLVNELWESGGGCVSVQVLQEFYVASTRKLRLSEDDAEGQVLRLSAWAVHAPSPRDVLAAIGLHRTHQLSFWDAMILRSAHRLGCTLVYSEDLNPGQTIGDVTIRNPFA